MVSMPGNVSAAVDLALDKIVDNKKNKSRHFKM